VIVFDLFWNKKMQKLLTTEDVAEALQLSIRTIQIMVKRGDLPRPIKIGGSVRWRAEDLEAAFAALNTRDAA